jgi:outer membrane receptor for ferrienterochelin and colicins
MDIARFNCNTLPPCLRQAPMQGPAKYLGLKRSDHMDRDRSKRRNSITHYYFRKKTGLLRLLAGVAVACCLLGWGMTTVAEESAADALFKVSIEAGPLEDALNQFALQTGLTLSFASDLVEGLETPGLNGRYGVAAGLARLLGGHGLEAAAQENGSYVLKKAEAPKAAEEKARGSQALPETRAAGGDDVTQLATFVVSASGYEQNVPEAPATITVITAEDIGRKSYTDITDVLKNVPGVFIDGGGSNQSILMRGLGADYVLFLIDGKPMQGADAFVTNGNLRGAQMNFLPSLENIERIEVIRGPASSLYGSDAMGGVINIITKKNVDKVTGGISVEYILPDAGNETNSDAYNTSLYFSAPLVLDRLALSISGSFSGNDESDFSTTTTGSGSSDPEYKKRIFEPKLILTPNDIHTLTLGYQYAKQERTFSLGKSLAENSRWTEDSYMETIKQNYYLTHEAKYQRFNINSYINYDDAENPTRVNSETGNGIEMSTLTLNTQGTYFIDAHTLSAGLTYKGETLSDGATNGLTTEVLDLERYQWSIFGEEEWRVLSNLALTLSGRFDNNEYFGDNFSPRLYAVYSMTDNLILKGGLVTGYKAPTLRQASTDFASTSRGGYVIGNPDLEPEKSVSYEVGLSYDRVAGLKASIVAYHTDFENKLERTDSICAPGEECVYNGVTYPANSYGYTTYENVDEAEVDGVEITVDFNIIDSLMLTQNYTYTATEITSGDDKGEPLNDVAEYMYNAGLEWLTSDALSLWTQLNYVGETSDSECPGYTFVDLGLVYKLTDVTTVKLGIYNVANKKVTTEDYDVVLDGMRYSLAMDVKF